MFLLSIYQFCINCGHRHDHIIMWSFRQNSGRIENNERANSHGISEFDISNITPELLSSFHRPPTCFLAVENTVSSTQAIANLQLAKIAKAL